MHYGISDKLATAARSKESRKTEGRYVYFLINMG
jgi:hypothetical protein